MDALDVDAMVADFIRFDRPIAEESRISSAIWRTVFDAFIADLVRPN